MLASNWRGFGVWSFAVGLLFLEANCGGDAASPGAHSGTAGRDEPGATTTAGSSGEFVEAGRGGATSTGGARSTGGVVQADDSSTAGNGGEPPDSLECAVGLTRCGEECVSLDRNAEHCGDCWNSCPMLYPLCNQGFCIHLIEQTGGAPGMGMGGSSVVGSTTGGGSGGELGGATAEGGSSGTAGTLASGGVSGAATGGAGSSGAPTVECGDVPQEFPEFERACGAPTDCLLVEHETDCCGTLHVIAINADQAACFADAEATCRAQYPDCDCTSSSVEVEDGSTLVGPWQGLVESVCDGGTCSARHTGEGFACGDKNCTFGEYCRLVSGGPVGSLPTYTCETTECADCDCLNTDCNCEKRAGDLLVTCEMA